MESLSFRAKIALLSFGLIISQYSHATGEQCGTSFQSIADKASAALQETLKVTASHPDDYQYVVDNNKPALDSNLAGLAAAETPQQCYDAASMLILYAQQMKKNTVDYQLKYSGATSAASATSTTAADANASTTASYSGN